MSVTISFPFDTPGNYSYNSSEIEIDGEAKLVLEEEPIFYEQTFDDDTGFTYDSSKAEFSGGAVQQIDKRPTDAIFYSSFNTNENGNWGEGTLTGTLGGSAVVSGGELDLTGGDGYITYPVDNLATMVQQGTIIFRWKPNYTGNAPTTQTILQTSPNTTDRILIRHNGDQMQVYGFCGASQIMSLIFDWTPSTIKYYELSINFDFTGGTHRFFIDGILQDTETGKTGTRGGNTLFRVGPGSGSDCSFDDILFYDTVQHTTNYTPDWSDIYDTIYIDSAVILPEFEHAGLGTIISFDEFNTVETGEPRYTVQIGRSGDYLYFNGAVWAISDGTYDQANIVSVFNANISSLDVMGETYGQFQIHFHDTNDLDAVSTLEAVVTVNTGYPTTNPYLELNTSIRADSLISIIETATKSGSDEVKYIFIQNSDYIWYDSTLGDFTASDGTYAQSNSASELQAILPAFSDLTYDYGMRIFLHSDDGTTTPELDTLALTYDLAGDDPDDIYLCEVVFDLFQTDADADTQDIIIELVNDPVQYKDNVIIRKERYTKTPNINGRVTQKLAETINMALDRRGREQRYKIKIGSKTYYINVPEQSLAYFWDLVV